MLSFLFISYLILIYLCVYCIEEKLKHHRAKYYRTCMHALDISYQSIQTLSYISREMFVFLNSFSYIWKYLINKTHNA